LEKRTKEKQSINPEKEIIHRETERTREQQYTETSIGSAIAFVPANNKNLESKQIPSRPIPSKPASSSSSRFKKPLKKTKATRRQANIEGR